MTHKRWSARQECPDCHQDTLRVWWVQRDDLVKRTDEFCDNPDCTRGDRDETNAISPNT